MPMSRGQRRPRASLMGPTITWPSDRPSIRAIKVSCVCDIVAARSWLTVGREGKYISLDSGANAVSPPRMSTWSARTLINVFLLSVTLCSVPETLGFNATSWLLCCSEENSLVDMLPPIYAFLKESFFLINCSLVQYYRTIEV